MADDAVAETAQQLFDQLSPGAQSAYREHIQARTPPELQADMKPLVDAVFPPPPPEPPLP